jgi:hypothetical protein
VFDVGKHNNPGASQLHVLEKPSFLQFSGVVNVVSFLTHSVFEVTAINWVLVNDAVLDNPKSTSESTDRG